MAGWLASYQTDRQTHTEADRQIYVSPRPPSSCYYFSAFFIREAPQSNDSPFASVGRCTVCCSADGWARRAPFVSSACFLSGDPRREVEGGRATRQEPRAWPRERKKGIWGIFLYMGCIYGGYTRCFPGPYSHSTTARVTCLIGGSYKSKNRVRN